MKIEEAVECMSKSYLHRILDSYTKDTIKPDEEESRKRIVADKNILCEPENIARRLHFTGITFDAKTLSKFLIEALLDAEGCSLDERTLIELVISYEKKIIEEASNSEVFKLKDSVSIKTYTTVLEVALEDNVISDDEKRLLTRLRTHLDLSLRDHYLIQATLNCFPKTGNELHTEKEVKSELVELQKRGIVFFCNQCGDGPTYLIPDEVEPGVKSVLGVELSENTYELLLDKLTTVALKQILEAHSLPVSGKKEERVNRITKADILPSDALGSLSSEELYSLCKSLPGVNVSGTKATRIKNVINHFDRLRVVASGATSDPREKLYDYYIELAGRDRQNLLSNNIISKDKDMDSAFEEATRFLFEEKLGLSLEPMPGSEHPDGLLRFGKSKELFMWDTKSKESTYKFPNDHLNQFKRYIYNSTERVNCFLVIAPTVSDDAIENTYRLKVESQSDTDVAIINAEDLKWIAENWKDSNIKEGFNLEVFNFTGILNRANLKQRMRIFLK